MGLADIYVSGDLKLVVDYTIAIHFEDRNVAIYLMFIIVV
jgi:hypothetical protein